MDLKELETFVCVAKLGSFRGAANCLNTTQPAVSQRIARLERELGTQLLDRDGRRIVPTPQGRKLLDYAVRMLDLHHELMEAVSGASALNGVIRLGTSETLVHTWLPNLIREASAVFPRLSLEMDVDITPRMLEKLEAFELDLAFMVGPVSVPEVQTAPIATYPVAFVASPALGWKGRRISIDELAAWPIVTFPRRTQPFQAVAEIFRKTKQPAVRLHGSASLATATRMAADGTCIAAIPPAIVQSHIERGELEIVETDAELPDLHFVAAWIAERANPAVTALVDMARKVAEARPHQQGRNLRAVNSLV